MQVHRRLQGSFACRITAALVVLLACALPLHAQDAKFSGQRAMDLTRQIVTFGPRYNGSEGKTRAEAYLKKFFAPETAKGWLETDAFLSGTPAGPQSMRNYIVRFPGTKPGAIVVASHYETNYPLRMTSFVGANDGACTSAILMEMASVLRGKLVNGKLPGYSVWLVFFDGEEAVEEWTHADSLYGSRHLAAKWQANGTLGGIKALLIADMIGDRSLNILREQNSTPWVEDVVYQAAKNTGHTANFFKSKNYIEDDHLPFVQRGVPVADVIDMDYGPHDSKHPDGWHHTPEDTLDKLSVGSLQVSGEVLMETVKLLSAK
jgi:Zn-dependent M28 family amino/carboxypeptidase